MKKLPALRTALVFAISLTGFTCLQAQNVALNTSGNSPDVSAMLDIVHSSKGLLIPRVALVSTTDAVTVPTPATSLLVYNTNASLTGTNAAGTGYYYNSGTSGSPVWIKLAEQGNRWDDLRVELNNGADGATINFFSGATGPQIYYFRDAAGLESMSFVVQLPHTWKEGTTIYPHLHWSPKDTKAGNVEWNLDYSWVNYDPVTPQAFPAITTSTVVATGPFTSNTHMISALTTGNAGLDGTGKKISSILICKLWRNSANTADTYEANAGLLFLDFHIQVDGYGSEGVFTK